MAPTNLASLFSVLFLIGCSTILPNVLGSQMWLRYNASTEANCSGSCSETEPCRIPSAPISIVEADCEVFIFPSETAGLQILLNSSASSPSTLKIMGTEAGILRNIILNITAPNSLVELNSLQIYNLILDVRASAFTTKSVTLELNGIVSHGIISSSEVKLGGNITVLPAGNIPVSTFDPLYASILMLYEVNMTLPNAVSTQFVPAVQSNFAVISATSLLPSSNYSLRNTHLLDLRYGMCNGTFVSDFYALRFESTVLDRRSVPPESLSPLFPSLSISEAFHITNNSQIYKAPMTIILSPSTTVTLQGVFEDSYLKFEIPSGHSSVSISNTVFLRSSPLPSDPPLLSIYGSGSFSSSVLNLPPSTEGEIGRINAGPSSASLGLCDLYLSSLSLNKNSISVGTLCISGELVTLSDLRVEDAILGQNTEDNILRGFIQPEESSQWYFNSIKFTVNIYTNISVVYNATKPLLGIHAGWEKIVSFRAANPAFYITWPDDWRPSLSEVYPLLNSSQNLRTPANYLTTEGLVISSLRGADGDWTFRWSRAALPQAPLESPSTPVPLTCPPPRPSDIFYCVNGHWQTNSSVETPTIEIPNIPGQTIVVQGNLTVTETVIFNGVDTTLYVNGCVILNGTVQIVITESEIEALSTHVGYRQLIQQYGCNGATDLSLAHVTLQKPQSCKDLDVSNTGSRNSLTVLFNVSESRCRKKTPIAAIVVPSVIGALLIISSIAALAYVLHQRAQEKASQARLR